MNIQLRLFGVWRELHPSAAMSLEFADGATVADLRHALAGAFPHADAARVTALLAVSAFAGDSELLRDGDPLPANGEVAILPPVSGG